MGVDKGRIEKAVREILEAIGEDPDRDGLQRTPLRIAEMYDEIFAGRAHVAYIPGEDGRITGLSKIARLVDGFAKRPQVQERLTTQIADALVDVLKPDGVFVVIEAEHMCMSMRGVKKPGSLTITSAVRGLFKTNPATRAEAMSLITHPGNRL